MAGNLWITLGLLATVLILGACGGGSSSSKSDDTASEAPPMPTACSPASTATLFCLTFTGSQYASTHAGEKFEVSIVASDGVTVVAHQSIAALPANGFFINFPRTLVAGSNYYVDYYADHNRNSACDAPATDHVWRSHDVIDFFHGTVTLITPSGVTGDVRWDTVHDDPFLTDGNPPSVTHPNGMNTCAQLP